MEGAPALIVTATFFTLGGLAGCLLAFQVQGEGAEALASYLDQFFHSLGQGALISPALPSLLWRTLRWPLAAFLLGFTALGLLAVPVLDALRGFFLAFSIASFARAYGMAGLRAAFVLLGVTALVAVPVLLLLSAQSFSAALNLAARGGGQGRRDLPYHRDYFLRSGVCAAAMGVCVLLERYLIPVLVAGALKP